MVIPPQPWSLRLGCLQKNKPCWQGARLPLHAQRFCMDRAGKLRAGSAAEGGPARQVAAAVPILP